MGTRVIILKPFTESVTRIALENKRFQITQGQDNNNWFEYWFEISNGEPLYFMVKGSCSQQCINKSLVVTQGYLQIIDTWWKGRFGFEILGIWPLRQSPSRFVFSFMRWLKFRIFFEGKCISRVWTMTTWFIHSFIFTS